MRGLFGKKDSNKNPSLNGLIDKQNNNMFKLILISVRKMPLRELALWSFLLATVIGFVVVLLIRLNQTIQVKKVMTNMVAFAPIVTPLSIRSDTSGDGRFQASRSNGARTHDGVDLLVREGQPIYAPFDAVVVRKSYPYKTDMRWEGLLLRRGDGLEVKVFYMTPSVSAGTMVKAGQKIGTAQSIKKKYGGSMRDHTHVEVWVSGKAIDPTPFIFGKQVA
jgi:murein DD-endopeptidase MepM/ murein hydrolase activator NlpD